MTLRPLACALAIGLAATVALPADAAKKRTSKPRTAATSAACTDFHAHANAGWLATHPLPAGAGAITALGELDARATQQQIDLLDTAMRQPQDHVQKLLGDFWASGLDEAAVERDGAKPIQPLLARINAIRKTRDIAPSIAALHQVGIPVAFDFGADIDLADLGRHIGYFSQGGLALVDPAFYTRTDAGTVKMMARYREYVQTLLALTGTPAKRVAEEARQVIDLETRIARLHRPVASLADPRSQYARIATATLGGQYPRLQLDAFLKAQGVNDDSVSLANPELFAQLDGLVGNLKPDQWKTYLRWRVADTMAPYLSKPFQQASFDFRGRLLAGQDAPAPRAQRVREAINLAAGPMLGRQYVTTYLPPATRERAIEIATQVRAALVAAVERDTRFGPAAKAEATAKLAALKIEVGAPRRDLDYTVQPMGRGSFGANMLIASTWHHREEMKRIGRGNADRRWNVLPQQPALTYDGAQNRLIITAAMLQPPVLDPHAEIGVQYGALGALVGHEISHAIGPRGRMVDARGDVRDWWTATEAGAWSDVGNRIASRLGRHPYPGASGTLVNGPRVRDIALADQSGVELAWAAYRSAQPNASREAQQGFFNGWAGLWAEQVGPEVAVERAQNSAYPPGPVRTNTPLANLPAFGAVYACKAGTPMQAVPAERLILWK
ncbi:M13-type metalloendopeptidase [Aerolutibacter ruishenii]|uniref:Putative endopeptidase n=1 Tax=Aerolutibacter ruishenii TaxID=686800 RepID=A0A562LSP8_9GAMM|nr:M13 family metallopeptidase [Lysobacter ruishenii]TWI10639.1 putative endopeptidase [Lysobacter ruishenii]